MITRDVNKDIKNIDVESVDEITAVLTEMPKNLSHHIFGYDILNINANGYICKLVYDHQTLRENNVTLFAIVEGDAIDEVLMMVDDYFMNMPIECQLYMIYAAISLSTDTTYYKENLDAEDIADVYSANMLGVDTVLSAFNELRKNIMSYDPIDFTSMRDIDEKISKIKKLN